MFGFLKKKKEDPDRKRAREEFDEIMQLVLSQDIAKRAAVGHVINMANGLFRSRFNNVQLFMSCGQDEQIDYLRSLQDLQDKLPEHDIASILGFNLFTKWVTAMVMGDKELLVLFTEGLSIIADDAPEI